MNRFAFESPKLHKDETFVGRDTHIKLYDGNEKTEYEDGDLILTSHRLYWGRLAAADGPLTPLCLHLKYITSVNHEFTGNFMFGRKLRIILNLLPPQDDKGPGPESVNNPSFIKLSGRFGVDMGFAYSLRKTLNARVWEVRTNTQPRKDDREEHTSSGNNSKASTMSSTTLRMRTGIGGIERAIETKNKQTDKNIALAFQDLNVLMGMAKDMVNISGNISEKIRMQKGEISHDETVRFKSYLLSLGISDPVTRDNYPSDILYYRNLAKQICEMLLDPIEACGGMMSLADVYCRVNRARGLELLSPEDLLQACRLMDGPIKMRTFPSGAIVLQLDSHSDSLITSDTLEIAKESTSLTVEQLAKKRNISLLLAKERLLAAERLGLLCRDESLCGLCFYPNLLLNRASEIQ